MVAAKMTTHATEQSSVASHSSLAATEYAINHNVGGNVDASASMPITTQLLTESATEQFAIDAWTNHGRC